MKIMVIGASGMLGYVTYQYLSGKGHQVIGVGRKKRLPGITCLDVINRPVVESFLKQTPCDAVVNCAALLAKTSEMHKSDAVKLNAWFPHYLSEYCTQNGAYLIQVSTDGVFSGAEGNYDEHSLCDAETFYGRSKLLGEVGGDALTVRSGFWGADVNPDGVGLFNWFMRQRKEVSGYSKAFFNGVSNLEFARFVSQAIRERWTGIYHLRASNSISKYEFLCLQKTVFSKEIQIHRNESVVIDRTLNNTRRDIPYTEKTFTRMMGELNVWLQGRKEFAHYFDREG